MTISVPEACRTLGLERDATPEQVKKAYRKLALQFHPDKNPDPAATAKFQQLSAAYKRLDDHSKGVDAGGDEEFQDFFNAEFGDFDDEEFDLEDEPSMEEMLFMFDMLFGAPPPARTNSRNRGGKRTRGKKTAGPRRVRVNLRRRGGRQEMPSEPGFPSYVDQELMEMFAHSMIFGDEEDFLASAFAHAGMDSDYPWGYAEEAKPANTAAKTKAKMHSSTAAKAGKSAKDGSIAAKKSAALSPPPLGCMVCVHGRHEGVVMFTGNVHYAKGSFVGVALSSPVGKNDGSVKGVRYFECAPCHGQMVRPEDVTPLAA